MARARRPSCASAALAWGLAAGTRPRGGHQWIRRRRRLMRGSGTMPEQLAGPPPAQPAAAGHLPPDEFDRWYGGWEPLAPSTIAEFMEGFERPWWIVGGWSVEAFTGIPR